MRHIHIPRTGGRSVRAALVPPDGWPAEWHLTAQELTRRYGPPADGDLVFTFVRDPRDRALSTFRFFFEHCPGWITPQAFRSWVRNGMLNASGQEPILYRGADYAISLTAPQVTWIQGDRMDFVGRYERLAEDFGMLRRMLGIYADLPHIGASRPMATDGFYDAATLALVEERYREDFDAFGWWPAW